MDIFTNFILTYNFISYNFDFVLPYYNDIVIDILPPLRYDNDNDIVIDILNPSE
jgi:hypothetical protein